MKQVHLQKLTTRFITREKGSAVVNVLTQSEFTPTAIDLNDIAILAYPFLDEMILKASKAGILKEIVFKTDDETTLDKLAYIAGVRGVDITISTSTHKKHRLQPKALTRQKAVVVENKETPNIDQ
jgi:hypothetical protein